MHYGHIASDKGASIYLWKECAIFRYSNVNFTYEKNIPFGNMIGKQFFSSITLLTKTIIIWKLTIKIV